ncbi:hypothetical protein PTSG_02777 [Salpingoeca rosetta]|uniref:Importin subunit alpha n=1 Tax=Salpingoeca rosetta (strain ATCC 50818 / BSB-021) TaxID=946362 RepID=F2U3A3_SALR5|nr:uncharacterized protein PTSG_02777 [Salpingoeca rosetta]EGD82097.1 hypothetical protein PTSG_02777 [Salpingoeca rosetta]|eukprot:XP_004996280.1 hypothetical protein PTSG_02777 [Salpingoeca rosetta]
MRFEAIWCITNIAAGDTYHTQVVAECEAVPTLISLLSRGTDRIREQAAWALGNIAGDSEMMRDYVIECGVVEPLKKLIQTSGQVPLLRNASWAVTNLCRGNKPPPAPAAVRPFLATLLKLLHSGDDEIVINGCWCAVFLSIGSTDNIQQVIETGACAKLVELLLHDKWAVVTPALRALGNIVTGNDIQTQVCTHAHAFMCTHVLIYCARAVKKECLWVLSNILAGTDAQIQAVIDANLIQLVLDSLEHGEFRVQREAAWALCNALASGADDQIRFMVSQGCIPPLCAMLKKHDAKLVGVVLQGLYSILTVGKRPAGEQNDFHDAIEQCGGLETLMLLAVDENENISRRSRLLLEKFLQPMHDAMVELDPDFDGHMYSVDQMHVTPSNYHV